MAQVYVAGPCEIHVGIGSAGSLVFLGWTESGVTIYFDGAYEDVPADLAGTRVPFDVQAMSEQAFISGDLKVWNESVLAQCQARANPRSGTPGTIDVGDIGRLMLAEGAAYRYLVYSPYQVLKPVMASDRQYNFIAGWLVNENFPKATRASKVRMLARAIPAYDTATGKFFLYNQDIIGKPIAA